ncbi:hypothetical protein HDE_02294 [Halotydeus destructor]|nr:hypothetical protein HDE_02294 [Halotydeus destructor]
MPKTPEPRTLRRPKSVAGTPLTVTTRGRGRPSKSEVKSKPETTASVKKVPAKRPRSRSRSRTPTRSVQKKKAVSPHPSTKKSRSKSTDEELKPRVAKSSPEKKASSNRRVSRRLQEKSPLKLESVPSTPVKSENNLSINSMGDEEAPKTWWSCSVM